MTALTPTDRPKSVRYRCVIEVFGGVFILSIGCRIFCVGIWVFVIGLSQISFFFSQNGSSIATEYVVNTKSWNFKQRITSTLIRFNSINCRMEFLKFHRRLIVTVLYDKYERGLIWISTNYIDYYDSEAIVSAFDILWNAMTVLRTMSLIRVVLVPYYVGE